MEPTHALEHKLAILEYWTLVEFFSPYLVDNYLNSNQHYQRVYFDDPCEFSWKDHPPLAENDLTSTLEKGYHLYLGLFSIEETADRARHVFSNRPSTWQSVDWRQCASPGTHSCFARLTLTKFGTPLFGTLSLSTLPWAHGNLLDQDASFLTMESFWKSVQRLLLDLNEEFKETLTGPEILEEAKSCCKITRRQVSPLLKSYKRKDIATLNNRGAPNSLQAFQDLFRYFYIKYGERADFSRIDWTVSLVMKNKGYSVNEIANALRHGSLNIEKRKSGHVEDYINRTIGNIL